MTLPSLRPLSARIVFRMSRAASELSSTLVTVGDQLARLCRDVARIAGVELRVVEQAELGVEVVDRIDAQHTRDGGEPARQRVLVSDPACGPRRAVALVDRHGE